MAEAHERAAKRAEDVGPLGRRGVGRDEPDGFAVFGESRLAIALGPGQVAQASVKEPRKGRVGGGVGQRQRLAEQLARPVELAAQVGRLRGASAPSALSA